MPKLHVPPAPDEFVRPKVGDTVWYYFEHAFWDVPMKDRVYLNDRGEPENVKQWRFTGRTEMRARAAIVKETCYDWRVLHIAPEYTPDDRVLFFSPPRGGVFARLALRVVVSSVHSYRTVGHDEVVGRIVNGVLPSKGTWGVEPLPPIGGGR